MREANQRLPLAHFSGGFRCGADLFETLAFARFRALSEFSSWKVEGMNPVFAFEPCPQADAAHRTGSGGKLQEGYLLR